MSFLYDTVQYGADMVNQYVQGNSQAVSNDQPIIDSGTVQAIGEGVQSLVGGIKSAGGVGNFFKNAWTSAKDSITGLFKGGANAASTAASTAGSAAGAAGTAASGATKIGSALKNVTSLSNLMGVGAGILGSMSGKDLSGKVKGTREAIRTGLQFIPGVGQGIALATAAIDFIGDKTGLNLSQLDKNATRRFGIKGAGFQNTLNALPGVSMFPGMFAGNTIEAKKSDVWDASDGIARAAYSGTGMDIDAAQTFGNKRVLFNRGKMNRVIREQNLRNSIAELNVNQAKLAREGAGTYTADLNSQYQNQIMGNRMQTAIGKNGMKLPELSEVKMLLATRKFQAGGKMNVIVEGAFHSRKNHLSEINPELEDVTPKGIPVITRDEGGEIVQTAEVEQKEMILHLELTQKLEELYQNGSEEAMIEAGKLLTEEIINNTDDRTGKVLNDGTDRN